MWTFIKLKPQQGRKKDLDLRPWKHDHRCYRFLSFINKMPPERLPCLGGLFQGILPGLIPMLFLNKGKILGCKWEKKPLPRLCKGRPKAQGLHTHLVFWDLDQVTWLPYASVSSHFMGPPPEEAFTSSCCITQLHLSLRGPPAYMGAGHRNWVQACSQSRSSSFELQQPRARVLFPHAQQLAKGTCTPNKTTINIFLFCTNQRQQLCCDTSFSSLRAAS